MTTTHLTYKFDSIRDAVVKINELAETDQTAIVIFPFMWINNMKQDIHVPVVRGRIHHVYYSIRSAMYSIEYTLGRLNEK